MATYGHKEKLKRLGAPFPGQLLCWWKIRIGANAIEIYRYEDGVQKKAIFVEDQLEVENLKAKLRIFYARMQFDQRLARYKSTYSGFELLWFYPSHNWDARKGYLKVVGNQALSW